MLLARNQNLQHLRTLGIHTLQHIKKVNKNFFMPDNNIFFFFPVELTEIKLK